MKTNIIRILFCFAAMLSTVIFVGCGKQNEWLDVKRNKSDVVPETLGDFQAILDNTVILTTSGTAGLAGADNFYFSDANFPTAPELDRNLYTWNKEIWINGSSVDWTFGYRAIEYANIVLDGLKKVEGGSSEYNNIKGQGLFWRAFALYNLTQTFCKQYDAATASSDLGLPLRETSDANQTYQRSDLKSVYDNLLNDAVTAYGLLSENPPFTTRPSKAAAAGLLARIYLVMGDYASAFDYADKALKLKSTLLDFNSSYISLGVTYRFPIYSTGNPEILFYAQGQGYNGLTPSTTSKGFVNPVLYSSYATSDLRKTVYYINNGPDNQVQYRGTYTGSNATFTGVGTNEIYLIRAECNARLGRKDEAMSDLNTLLKHRYKTGQFSDMTAADSEGALRIILVERRKELAYTGNIRWEDLRRLNKDSRFAITLTRDINGVVYTLPPNDNRYALPIPDNEIQATGLTQNPR